MKWLGFLVLTIAGALFGLNAQKQKRQRVDTLSQIEILLLDLEKRLQFTAVPIREWLSEAAHLPRFARLSFVGDTLRLLSDTDLETAWLTAIDNARDMTSQDVYALRLLGAHLGKSDAPTQLRCIRETVERISDNKAQATEKAEKARKLYVGLGTCAGMALALLLI